MTIYLRICFSSQRVLLRRRAIRRGGQCRAPLLIPSYKEIRDRRLKRSKSAAALAPELLPQM
jgi:hypothetical protein